MSYYSGLDFSGLGDAMQSYQQAKSSFGQGRIADAWSHIQKAKSQDTAERVAARGTTNRRRSRQLNAQLLSSLYSKIQNSLPRQKKPTKATVTARPPRQSAPVQIIINAPRAEPTTPTVAQKAQKTREETKRAASALPQRRPPQDTPARPVVYGSSQVLRDPFPYPLPPNSTSMNYQPPAPEPVPVREDIRDKLAKKTEESKGTGLAIVAIALLFLLGGD